jgi:hypothetical protein
LSDGGVGLSRFGGSDDTFAQVKRVGFHNKGIGS